MSSIRILLLILILSLPSFAEYPPIRCTGQNYISCIPGQIISAAQVSNANLASSPNNTIKSNVSGGSASPADNTFSSLAATTATISSNANAKGVANTFALSDHTHQITAGTATQDSVAQYDGTNWQAVYPETLLNPSRGIYLFDDFFAFNSGLIGPGSLLWNTNNSGTQAGQTSNGYLFATAVNHPGIIYNTTGTTATGTAGFYLGPAASPGGPILLGGGAITMETEIQIPILGVTAQQYFIKVGFVDTPSGTISVPNNGVYAQYAQGVDGNFWDFKCSNAGTTTTITSTAAVAANTWYKLTQTCNAAATSCSLAINNANTVTCNTNIPTAVSVVPTIEMAKTNGTTARTMLIDYFLLFQRFTTPR